MKKCPLCDKIKPLVIHVTEMKDGKFVENYSLCLECASKFLDFEKEKSVKPAKQELDLSNIETPEQLLDFILRHESQTEKTCSVCGLSWGEFDKSGKLGCASCYLSFKDEMHAICNKWHRSDEHTGKRPKNRFNADPIEKLKLLRLQLAKAIELEQYEKAAVIKKEIEQLSV